MGTGASFRGAKRMELEFHRSYTFIAEVRNIRSYTSTPSYVFIERFLLKRRDKFTFIIL
jgi:hypothetical protein